MKRPASPSSSSTAKQTKISKPQTNGLTSDSLDQNSLQCPTDMLLHGVDEAKCIAGKFKMTWPALGGKIETIALICSETSPTKEESIGIFFRLNEKYLAMLDFSPLDEFRLSLRGAELNKVLRSSNTCTLPMQLVFSKGVHISWRNRVPGLKNKVLNTWLVDVLHQTDSDNWYLSQEEQHDSRTDKLQEAEKIVNTELLAEKESSSDTRFLAKQEKKRKRVETKRLNQAAKSKMELALHPLLDSNVQLKAVSRARDISNLSPTSSSANDHELISAPLLNAGSSSSQLNTPKPFNAGFRSGHEVYPALTHVRLGQFSNLCGIVTEVSTPSRTSSGDLMCCVQIVDPSNYDDLGFGRPRGFKINCFTKRHEEWLPHPKREEVVILRNIKIAEWQGNLTGTGFYNKLCWAAFSSSKGEIHHGASKNAPREEAIGDDGFGATLSPFYHPSKAEIAYCIGLSDWWRALTEKQSRDSVIPIQRVHRLICDAGPEIPPNGYFDCTVEVLKLFVSSSHLNTVHTMYATDYTRRDDMMGQQSNSWPSALSEYVLQFEMWDDAARFAEGMRPGQYYAIKNARMRINPARRLEGKVVGDRITLLDEQEAVTNPHLKALLERKQNWEIKIGEPRVEYQLIQDVKEGNFFDCTVEFKLLHAVCKANKLPHVFVTDYTMHPNLSSTVIDQPWSAGLEGCIIKIFLSEEQKHNAESPAIGSFYAIRKLRLKYSSVEDCFCGILGGHEKLMTVLNPQRTDNEHLNGLIRRKEDWAKNREIPLRKKVIQESIPEQRERNPSKSIKDMSLSNWDTGRFSILAKVVDFYPLELRDAFYQQCSRCKQEIPYSQRACFKCQDFDREYVQYLYQMYILVEDQDGEQIKVSINDQCALLDGLKRVNLQDDPSILNEFCKRLYPLVGKLTAVHDDLMSGKTVDLKAGTPFLCFEIDTWVVVPEAVRAFSLFKYEYVSAL